VSVIDEATNTVTATIPVGGIPFEVAVDPGTHTAYVTNYGSNTVTVISVGLGSQTITFTSTAPSGAVVGGPTYPVTATGGASGNPVTFSIDASSTSGCALSGSTVSFGGPAGTCVVDANQAGNTSYSAAAQEQQSFPVGLADTDLALHGVPDNSTVNATSPSGAVVSYTSPTVSDEETPPAVTCNHPSGSTFPIGTTTVTCMATDADDTPSTVTASFTVTVKGALAQLTDLLTFVKTLPPGTSLVTKTQNAINYYKAGDTADTCSTLSSIISQAKAQSGKKLTSTQAAAVVSAATRIRSVVGC